MCRPPLKMSRLPIYEFNNILAFAVCNDCAIIAIFPSYHECIEYIQAMLVDRTKFFIKSIKITVRNYE